MAEIIRCSRCQRRCRSQVGWNVTAERGVVVGVLCPHCQTPEENAEAEINKTTLTYSRLPDGRFVGIPKTTDGEG